MNQDRLADGSMHGWKNGSMHGHVDEQTEIC